MNATWKAGLVIGAVVLATLAIGVVQTKADKDTPDMTGTWTLDPAKSDLPAGGQLRRWGGGGGGGGRGGWGGHGSGGHGSWQGRGGGGDNPGDGGSGRGGWGGGNGFRAGGGGRLPRILHITQAPTAVLFADSAGAAFQEIEIGGSPTPSQGPQGDNDQFRHLSGHWASGTLEVERVNPRGGVMLQKYKLEDHGKTLEVRMERKDSGDGSSDAPKRAPREFKMVYRRTA